MQVNVNQSLFSKFSFFRLVRSSLLPNICFATVRGEKSDLYHKVKAVVSPQALHTLSFAS